MNKKHPHQPALKEKPRVTRLGIVLAVLCWALLTGFFVYLQRGSLAQTPSARFSAVPASGTYQVGQNFTVAVQVNLSSGYNAASTNLYYNKATMTYVSAALNNGSFNGSANTIKHNASGGYIEIYDNRTSGGSLRGTHTLATITFRAKAAGSGHARPTGSKAVEYPTASYGVQNVNGNYTIQSPPPPVTDVCPNIAGTQTSVPAGHVKDGNGNCVVPAPQPTDVCPNIAGTQTSVPAGHVKDGNGNCVVPAPQPTNPTPSTPKPPSVIRRQPTASVPTASAPSQTGQQITDVSVTELDYRRAVITWNTTKPSSSKINFSTNKDDLWNEENDEQAKTNHKIVLENEKVRAGNHYFFRISAADDDKAVTVDGEFDTKAVTVIISVTNEENAPVSEAQVVVNKQTLSTDENGEVQLDMPEGEQFIVAEKDELVREVYATINIPETDEETQRITLMLSKRAPPATTSRDTTSSKGTSLWVYLLIPLLLLPLGFGLFVFIKRRKSQQPNYIGDPLEAENYTQNVLPTTPLPNQDINSEPPIDPPAAAALPPLPLPITTPEDNIASPQPPENEAAIPHHTSLPEMLGRYGTAPEITTPQTAATATDDVSPITGQPIPHHTSLKDLVKTPDAEPELAPPDYIDTSDLPVAPAQPTTQSEEILPSSPYQDENDTPKDNTTLSIKH